MSLFDEIKCEDLLNNFLVKDSLQRTKKYITGQNTAGQVDVKTL